MKDSGEKRENNDSQLYYRISADILPQRLVPFADRQTVREIISNNKSTTDYCFSADGKLCCRFPLSDLMKQIGSLHRQYLAIDSSGTTSKNSNSRLKRVRFIGSKAKKLLI